MNLLTNLETYISSQKSVGIYFIIIGIGLLLVAVLAHLYGNSLLSKGLKISALICGVLILSGGVGYRITESKLLETKTKLYQQSSIKFQQIETERMAKVVKDYPVYQYIFGAFIILALLVVWLVKNPYWHGVAFSVILLFTGVMISEAYSYISIKTYHEVLKKKLPNPLSNRTNQGVSEDKLHAKKRI